MKTWFRNLCERLLTPSPRTIKKWGSLTIWRANGMKLAVAHRWDAMEHASGMTAYVAYFQTAISRDELPKCPERVHVYDSERLRHAIIADCDLAFVHEIGNGTWITDVTMKMEVQND